MHQSSSLLSPWKGAMRHSGRVEEGHWAVELGPELREDSLLQAWAPTGFRAT